MMSHTEQDKNVTNISNICPTPYNGKVYLAVTHEVVLVSLDFIILIGSFVANTLVVLIIVRTK